MSKGISYRLGVLDGTLKAQEQHNIDTDESAAKE